MLYARWEFYDKDIYWKCKTNEQTTFTLAQEHLGTDESISI